MIASDSTDPSSTSDANCKPWLLTNFWQMGYKEATPTTSSLGWINFFKWPTEPRKPVDSQDYCFIMKGLKDAGQQLDENIHRARSATKELSSSRSLGPRMAYMEISRRPSCLVFINVPLHRYDWLNRWSLVTNSSFSPSPLLRGWDRVQTLYSWFPFLRCFLKVTSLT